MVLEASEVAGRCEREGMEACAVSVWRRASAAEIDDDVVDDEEKQEALREANVARRGLLSQENTLIAKLQHPLRK